MEIDLTDDNFKQEVLESELPVLVDFWASWCGPCSMLAPVIKEIAEEYQGKLKVCKVNVDQGRRSASEYEIMSVPTLIFFKKGQIIDRSSGVLPKAELQEKINSYL